MISKRSLGTWITIGHTGIAELLARKGFDWLTIDMEHSSIDIQTAFSLIQVISLCGVTPFVRVTNNDPNLIKRVMDAGAHGVIVPSVNSKQEAEQAVASVKYPPIGKRGVGLFRAQDYGYSFEEYKVWVPKHAKVIVQIEHIEAIRHLEEIVQVQGVDATFIGPYDLSGSLGMPGQFGHPEVLAALEEYERVCRKYNMPMGYHVVQPDAERVNSLYEKGYSFVAVGLDTLFLGDKVIETLDRIKK